MIIKVNKESTVRTVAVIWDMCKKIVGSFWWLFLLILVCD